MVSSGPMGAAPWDTHGSSSTPSSRTPTAPSSRTSSPRNSAVPPPATRADARPPTSGTAGADSESRRSTASVGNVAGPTGVGKTAVAIALADLLRADGEHPVAVSADALQVYQGLETLTGAATPAERR